MSSIDMTSCSSLVPQLCRMCKENQTKQGNFEVHSRKTLARGWQVCSWSVQTAQNTHKKHHGTTTTHRSRKNRGKQEAVALTGYSASYRHKTRGGPQEPSINCEQTACRAPRRRSAPPAQSTAAPAKRAHYDLKVCTLQYSTP